MVEVEIFDYVDRRGVNQIVTWSRELPKQDLARLNNKLRLLERAEPESLPKLLDGPGIQGEQEIFKLHLGGSGKGRAFRPLLCRGPGNKNDELTLLVGTEERDSKLPRGIARIAEERRQEIIKDPRRRCRHEWVSWKA